ncbi:hypothetical protein FF011L_47930 [Roseimaritima multifibrata]|uniref:Cna protein B-type domain protein n=1 Tax=Roseimaritima multifibrata TaxID=1930274 RepID=A0A517MM90_9BACT|nr:carboxypeptidase-like regulatory domain-containing protein [Roseimaritima multifibrata]QDS95989.1 hypothetical protein FF011L_47930 [Roseimaritima multifibrata]
MTHKIFNGFLALAMSFAMACPQALQAAHPSHMVVEGLKVDATVKDLVLQDGAIQGSLVSPNGKPIAGQAAVVAQRGHTLDTQLSDAEGRYAFKNLKPGVYQVATNAGILTYRVWNPEQAPEGAEQGIIQVAGDDVIRGGSACCSDTSCDGCDGMGGRHGSSGRMSRALANPTVVVLGAAAIAAAIAIPLALSDDDDAS